MQQNYKINWQQRTSDKWQELLADDAYTITGIDLLPLESAFIG